MTDAPSVLFQYGLAGVVIFGLSLTVVALYRDNQRLHNEKEMLQDARRLDAKDTADKVTAPMQSISQTISLIYDKLRISKEGQ